jgi:hypothetical protein
MTLCARLGRSKVRLYYSGDPHVPAKLRTRDDPEFFLMDCIFLPNVL